MFPIILEVAISLVVIYFLLSTLVSFINELIAMLFNSRGELLFKSLKHLFAENVDEKTFVNKIYDSHHITNFASKFGWFKILNKKTEYISSPNFASALIEQIQKNDGTTAVISFTELKNKINGLCNDSFIKTKLQEMISDLEDSGKNDIVSLKITIEKWFNSYMESVTILYKNSVQKFVFFISALVCFSMNVDTLSLIKFFFENKEKREIMVNYAETITKDKYIISDSLKGEARLEKLKATNKEILAQINTFDLPIGWDAENNNQIASQKKDFKSWVLKFLGIFLTTISLTLGAPFWYQLMIKLLDLRKNTTKPKTK